MSSLGRVLTASERRLQQDRFFSYLALFRTSLILLTALLLALARGALELTLDKALPFLDSTLGLWCLFHLLVLCTFPIFRRFPGSLKVQVTIDLIFSFTLVWWTGGVESFFLPILYAGVLATSSFFGLRQALLIATAATLTMGVMTILAIKGWSPAEATRMSPFGVQGRTSFVILCLTGEGIAFHIIAFLGARLMGGVRRTERLNNLIVENIDEGILALDEKGRLTLMNEEARQTLGNPRPESWRLRSPTTVFRRASDTELCRILENPTEGEFRLQWRMSRERVIPLLVRLRRIPGESKGTSVWLALLRDLTPEVRAAEADARLRRLQETEDMALGLVHEIRNPLASIRGCVQELGRGKLAQSQREKFTKITLRESDRLDRIVNEFMEAARTRPTQTERVELIPLLEEILETLQGRPDSRDVRIRLEASRDPVPVLVGQRELLYRIFLNLGVNAIEAINGTGRLEIVVRAAEGGWEVLVVDDGPGMDEATAGRIFNSFFTTKTREGGLGLVVVERLVNGHGGTIDVLSEPGVGTRFRIWFPAAPSDDGVRETPRATEDEGEPVAGVVS